LLLFSNFALQNMKTKDHMDTCFHPLIQNFNTQLHYELLKRRDNIITPVKSIMENICKRGVL
jgi:hypothetical protein